MENSKSLLGDLDNVSFYLSIALELGKGTCIYKLNIFKRLNIFLLKVSLVLGIEALSALGPFTQWTRPGNLLFGVVNIGTASGYAGTMTS